MKDPGPAISYITPTGGTGDLVQIQGYDFGSSRGSSAVLFGSVPATSYVSWDNQHVLVRVPAGVSGTIEVRVVTAAGQSNGVPFLAGWPAPTISSIAPSSGIGDHTMPIFAVSGTNFRSGPSVTLKKQGEPDIAATNVVVGSPENLRCDLDITGRATGQWDVVVANPHGQSSR